MATAVASRFAVLSIDDDDDSPKRNQKKKVETKKPGIGISTQKTDSNQKKKSKKTDPGKVSAFKIQKLPVVACKYLCHIGIHRGEDLFAVQMFQRSIMLPYSE
jgi:hypothetical protein